DVIDAKYFTASKLNNFTDDEWAATCADLRRLTGVQESGSGVALSDLEKFRCEVYGTLQTLPLEVLSEATYILQKAFDILINTLQGSSPTGKDVTLLRPLL